jgi:hypothetical protein
MAAAGQPTGKLSVFNPDFYFLIGQKVRSLKITMQLNTISSEK